MKNPFLSKTNWVQAIFLGLLTAEIAFPELQGSLCKDGKLVMALQIFMTLVARNMASNIAVRKPATEDPSNTDKGA